MTQLKLQNVSKKFGKNVVLSDINLEVEDGEFVSLVGPSGCGKTTLLRIIAGLESTSGGQVAIAEQNVNQLDPAQRNVAMVFQSYALYPHKTVYENIAFPLRMQAPWATRLPLVARLLPARQSLDREIRSKVVETASIMGLDNLLDRKPGQLSGGQRQRVALARAMVRNPALFLMDEPLSNLDAKLRLSMRSEIIELQRRLSGTFVYVTHDQSEAMTMSDRVVLMDRGHVQQIGKPNELYENPANLFVAQFIGSPTINTLLAEVSSAKTLKLFGNELRQFPDRLDGVDIIDYCHQNQTLLLGFRPEAFSLVAPNHPESLTGIVHLIENLGNELLLTVQAELDSDPTASNWQHSPGQIQARQTQTGPIVVRLSPRHGQTLRLGDRISLLPDWFQSLAFSSQGERLSGTQPRREQLVA